MLAWPIVIICWSPAESVFFFQAEDGIRGWSVTGVRRVLFRSSPDGKGNVLLQVDKDSAQPRSRVDLGKQREPVYAVDDIAGMLFLQTTPGTLAGYRL